MSQNADASILDCKLCPYIPVLMRSPQLISSAVTSVSSQTWGKAPRSPSVMPARSILAQGTDHHG